MDIIFFMFKKKLKNRYSEGYDERCGIISEEKIKKLNNQRPLWVHCVSVGEVQAAMSLIQSARNSGYSEPIIISTVTVTGREMANRLVSDMVDFHIYYPWDKRQFIRRVLDTLNPLGLVVMETEIWPNLLSELRERDIPTFASNCRVSDRTWKRFSSKLGSKYGREMYNLFSLLFLREPEDRRRLAMLGIAEEKLYYVGDTKFDALLKRKSTTDTYQLKETLCITSEDTVYIAGSLHPGEDEEILKAWKLLRQTGTHAKLILVPRHPERTSHVQSLFKQDWDTALMSEEKQQWEVLVVDKIGVLFELYGIADVAFVGGSIVNKGGQNILEPVVWGKPIQFGPYMQDFALTSSDLLSMGIANEVKNGEELGKIWVKLLDPELREHYQKTGIHYIKKHSGACEKTWHVIEKHLR